MSNVVSSGNEVAALTTEPYREAYVKHNLKKNEVPTIMNFRKSRTTRKAHTVEEMPKTANISSNGQVPIAVADTRQGGPHFNKRTDAPGQETSLGLADKLSSLEFVDSNDIMEDISEMTDEEFVSADEGSDETMTLKHLGSHCSLSLDNAGTITPSIPLPTCSHEFNLPRGHLGNAPRSGKARNVFEPTFDPTYSYNHFNAVDLTTPSDSHDWQNKRQVVNNDDPFRDDYIPATMSQTPRVFTPPLNATMSQVRVVSGLPLPSTKKGNKSEGTNNHNYPEAGTGVSMTMIPSRQNPAVLHQNSPHITLGTAPNHSRPIPSTVHSTGPPSYLPMSNVQELNDPLQNLSSSESALGLHGQVAKSEVNHSRHSAMAASPMKDVDCAHSAVHCLNMVNEGMGSDRTDSLARRIGTNTMENQGLDIGSDEQGRSLLMSDSDTWDDDGESEVDLEQDSNGGVNHRRNSGVWQDISRRNDSYPTRQKACNKIYTPMPFTEEEKYFKQSIRLYISAIFDYKKPLPIQTPSRRQLDAFNKSQKEVDGPNLETVLFDFEGPSVSTPWNNRLALLLANQFLKKPNTFTYDTARIQRAFMVCFRHLHRKYRKIRVVPTEDDSIKEQQDKRRTNQHSRKRNLRSRREVAAKRYANAGGQMKAFCKLWEEMPSHACSDDEEVTYPNGTTVHEILTPAWRNVAVKRWFRTWDHLAMSMRYRPDGKPTPGKFPHVRIEAQPVRRDPYAAAPTGLPINFYDDDWYKALDSIERQKLGARPAIGLTFPRSIIRTAERYEHIKHRKDTPLSPDDPTLTPV